MITYFITLTISTILNLISRILKDKKRIISIIMGAIGIVVPIAVCGFRYNVGTDFANYQEWFRMYINLPLNLTQKDFGFGLMIKFIQIFSRNPQLLFLISAFIINILILLFIKKNTKLYDLGYFLFMALYFYFSGFNITRQWIAISICLFCFKFAYEKKLIKYIVGILIAATIHSTAIIMLPIYFLFKLKITKKSMFIITISILILGLGLEPILKFIENVFSIDLNKYLVYFNGNMNLSVGANGYAYPIIGILTLLIIYILRKGYFSTIKYGKEQVQLLVIAIVVSFLGIRNIIFGRMQLYLIPIIIVCIPNIIVCIPEAIEYLKHSNIKALRMMANNKYFIKFITNRKAIYTIVIILGVIYLYRSLLINGGQVLPYHSIFSV